MEADPAVLNLSAFEQFFEERRPFFLEGSPGSSTSARAAVTSTPDARGLFYSRRIGRSPQLAGIYGDETQPNQHDDPRRSKVTGRLGQGLVRWIPRRGDAARAGRGRCDDRAADQLRRGSTSAGAVRWRGRHRSDDHRRQSRHGCSTATPSFGARPTPAASISVIAFSTRITSCARISRAAWSVAPRKRSRPRSATACTAISVPTTTSRSIRTRTSLTGDAERLTISKFGGGYHAVPERLPALLAGLRDQRSRIPAARGRADVPQLVRAAVQHAEQGVSQRVLQLQHDPDAGRRMACRPTLSLNTNWHVQFPNSDGGATSAANYGDFTTDIRRSRGARRAGGPPFAGTTSIWSGRRG